MRVIKFGLVGLVLLFSVGCSCKSRNVGPGDGNIPVASDSSDVLSDIHFGFDSYSLDAGAKAALRENASWLKQNSTQAIQIEGHCDSRGTNEYNMVLGQKRASSVYDYLRSLGIAANRMNTISYGEELPLDPRQTEAAWAKNRRAHFAFQE